MSFVKPASWFFADLPLLARWWDALSLRDELPPFREGSRPRSLFYRLVAARGRTGDLSGISAGELHLYALLQKVFAVIASRYLRGEQPGMLETLRRQWREDGSDPFGGVSLQFARWYPPDGVVEGRVPPERFMTDPGRWVERRERSLVELLLLKVSRENRGADRIRPLFDDREFTRAVPYDRLLEPVVRMLEEGPPVAGTSLTLPELLRQPLIHAPDSLYGQLLWVREHWLPLLPPDILPEIMITLVEAEEEWRVHAPRGEPGGAPVIDFQRVDDHYPEFEAYSSDTDWMPNVVMLAKMVYVWLGQLSREYGREISRLDQVPDRELDRIARRGFTALWLIGVWERSSASMKIKRLCGNPEAIASAYSLYDYVIAADLGGEEALLDLKRRAMARGIRLASDMVPNHTGIYSRWIVEHPDWFIQLEYPPYPTYTFNGPDLSDSPLVSIHIEDGYWDRRDAAVVFKLYDHRDGRTRYIYHGNDGTSTPWNDTAQLNYLLPEVREAVLGTIRHVASLFPIIRFDAAMTLAKKHYQRLWFPQPGHGGVPSRAEHGMSRERFDSLMPKEFWREAVDRMTAEAPDTLLLAEAFWLMEGYFVRTLGMHRVYNSAFMNMLKMEENAKYRLTIRNILEFDHRILQRFVNFMNNPDEKTAAEQFGTDRKYFGACVMLATLPGLPMFGHGQIEGFHEKYGMEYHRAYWDEPVNEGLVREHERLIFPLLRRRRLFSGSEEFRLYDFLGDGHVNEDLFVYSNRYHHQRALILYHNRHAECRGRIGLSTGRRVGEELERVTVGAGLGLAGDGVTFYRVRDLSDGLEYLFDGKAFHEGGIEFVFGPYQTRVLIDWREIRDDGFGTWRTLHDRLGGRGVRSMDDEEKSVRFEPEQRLFQRLLERFLAGEGETVVELAADANDMISRFGIHGIVCQPLDEAEVARILGVIGELVEREPSAKRFLPAVAASLVMELLDGRGEGPVSRHFGFGRVIEEYLSRDGADQPSPPFGHVPPLQMRFLAERGGEVAERLLRDDPLDLPSLLDDPEVGLFVGRHESGGGEWIVRERWELLLLFTLWREIDDVRRERLGEVIGRLIASAAAAGYRVDRLIEEWSGGEGAGGEVGVGDDPVDRDGAGDDSVDSPDETVGEEDAVGEAEVVQFPRNLDVSGVGPVDEPDET